MKAFITGISGFIGSRVAKAMVDSGYDVLGLVMPGDDLWRLGDISSKVKFIKGHLNDVSGIRDDLQSWRPQVCIHLAWYAEPGKYLNSKENLVSLQGSIDILQVLFECGCDHFIGAGTCAEYEMKSTPLSEGDSTMPETLYAATKLSLNLIGQQIAFQYGGLFSWGRIFYLYGPFEDSRRLIPAAIKAFHQKKEFPTTAGMQVRDYLHVDDVAGAFLRIAEASAPGTYNISSGVPVKIRDVLERLAEISDGKPEQLKFGDVPYPSWNPMYICGQNQRLRNLGWMPKYDLVSGLEQTFNWWHDKNQKESIHENTH